MRAEWDMVREFHSCFKHPIAKAPKMLEKIRVINRGKWMQEELNEFYEAKDMYEQADAMIDLIYFVIGTLVEMGMPPDELFAIVHEANMAKLWEDGTPHYNIEGKTIKPPNWIDPEQKFIQAIKKIESESSE